MIHLFMQTAINILLYFIMIYYEYFEEPFFEQLYC